MKRRRYEKVIRAALVATVAVTAPSCSLGLSDSICVSESFKNWDRDCCEQEPGGHWSGAGTCSIAIPGPFVPAEAPV